MITKVISMIIGVPLIVLGFIGWKKQKIFMLANKDKINIKEENKKEFTEAIGKAQIMLGICMIPASLIGFIDNEIYDAALAIIFILLLIISIVKSNRSLKKFNVGIWSK